MNDQATITTPERVELTEEQLNGVAGGNWFLGIAGSIVGSFIYDAITGRDNGGIVGAVNRSIMGRL